jgi:hypothetical protein
MNTKMMNNENKNDIYENEKPNLKINIKRLIYMEIELYDHDTSNDNIIDFDDNIIDFDDNNYKIQMNNTIYFKNIDRIIYVIKNLLLLCFILLIIKYILCLFK